MLFKRRLINKIKNIKFILNKSKYRNIPIQHLGETPESNMFIISQFIFLVDFGIRTSLKN